MKQIPCAFTAYEMTPEETVLGQSLSDFNLAHLQNLISGIAQQKLMLALDPEQPNQFVQNEAYLRGQIEILQHLVDLHHAAVQTRVL